MSVCSLCKKELRVIETIYGEFHCEPVRGYVTHPPERLFLESGEVVDIEAGDGLILDVKYYRQHNCDNAGKGIAKNHKSS